MPSSLHSKKKVVLPLASNTCESLMWKCTKCGETIEDTFDSCWNCGTADNGTSPRFPAPPSSQPATAPDSLAKLRHDLISLGAATLCLSFFLPWIKFGAALNGLDIQTHFESYRLIWLMPLLAFFTLVASLARQNTSAIRRLAGLCPFAILAYAMSNLGAGLVEDIQVGGWLALISGAVLVFTPNEPKTPA